MQQFNPPSGVHLIEVCADTGTIPSNACPEKRKHWFADDRPPLSADHDLYQKVRFDRNTGQLATEFTPKDAIEEKVFKIYPKEYRQWAEEHGIPQPPASPDEVFKDSPQLHISQPVEGEVVNGIVQIYGSANAPDFQSYELSYGVSHDPGAFSAPFAGSNNPVLDNLLGEWDTRTLGEGPHTIRLLVHAKNNATYEQRVRLFVAAATPTPQPTMTWTPPPPTLTYTPIADTPTFTPMPTDTAVAPPTDTPVVPPTDTPVIPPTDTAVVPPTDTPPAPPTETPLPTDTVAVPATDTPLPTDTVAAPPPMDTPTITPTVGLSEAPTETPTFAATATWTPQP
jgi:hypothetical protein